MPAAAIGPMKIPAAGWSIMLILLATGGAWRGADTQLYWGDTHLHTSYSVDAYATGNYVTDPDAAFRYARGPADTASGDPARRSASSGRWISWWLPIMRNCCAAGAPRPGRSRMSWPPQHGRRLADLQKENKRAVFGEVAAINTRVAARTCCVDLDSDRDPWAMPGSGR